MTDKLNENPEALNLVIALMEQNARESNYLSNQLMEGFLADKRRAEATIEAMRFKVESLFQDGYMPMPGRIIDGLYPSEDEIAAFLPAE